MIGSIDPGLVLDYLSGDLASDEELAFEEALFDDEAAGEVTAGVLAIVDTARYFARLYGRVEACMTPRQLDAFRRDHRLSVVEPDDDGATVHIVPDDAQFVAAGLSFPPATEGRIDVMLDDPRSAELSYFLQDAPVDRTAGKVYVVCHREVALCEGVIVRVNVTSGGKTRTLNEYKFSARARPHDG